jgi:hypothetical protein
MTIEEKEEWEYVYYKMMEEGFHYCFKHYSDFIDIKDEEFHRLRTNYLKSANELETYIKNKYKGEIDEE